MWHDRELASDFWGLFSGMLAQAKNKAAGFIFFSSQNNSMLVYNSIFDQVALMLASY